MSFIFKRPAWFKHEGYWRLAQVLRLGPAATFLAFSVASLGIGVFFARGFFELSLGWLAGSLASFVTVHWLLRLIAWIADGFKSRDKAA